jgi:lysozyme
MKKRTAVGGSAAIAIALASSTVIVSKWEGKSNTPYTDIVGVRTVCYGETRVTMRQYTDAECLEMLKKGLIGFQKEVLHCTPILKDHPYQLAAATSLAYNIGSKAYCSSRVAKRFNEGDFVTACRNFAMWRYAGKREVQGLINRRADEVQLCLRGL